MTSWKESRDPVKRWIGRHKVWTGIIIAVIVVGGLGALGSSESEESPSTSASPASSEESAPEEEVEEAADVVGGLVRGAFDRDALLADAEMVELVDTSDVWCGWRDGKVIVHVTMTNNSVEHITINWHPSYRIQGGSAHGTGFSAVQSDGFDSGETRSLEAEQDPEGTPENAAIARCYPSFQTIEAG